MISGLIKAIKSLLPGLPQASVVHPEEFHDPVALRVSWRCQKSGSANFTTHKLVKTSENNLVYRSTILSKVFGIPFIVIGSAMLIAYMAAIISHWIMAVIGPLFTIIGIVLIIQSMIPIGFDNQKRLFYRGVGKHEYQEFIPKKHCEAFSRIHAIQILTKIGRVSSSSEHYQQDCYFYAYELNLVLHDANREYVMTYIDLDQALMDADRITELIAVPVWKSVVE